MNKTITFQLFLSFLRLGITAFGGPAMVSYIKNLAVNKKKWIDEERFRHGIVLCQTLPGAIAVNVASYVGLKAGGIWGMAACFAGFILPAYILLLVFAIVYYETHSVPAMVSLFGGLQVIVVAIILNAMMSFGKNILKDRKDILIAFISAAALLLKMNPFLVVLCAALAGVAIYRFQAQKIAFEKTDKTVYFKNAGILLGFYIMFLSLLFFFDRALFDMALFMSKIEVFAFGSGFTALPLMFHEVVTARSWLDSKTFMDGVALGQVTPGPILINAAFVGYLVRGVAGSAVGTLAIFFPGLVLINLILPVYDRLSASPYFFRATRGVLAAFIGVLFFITVEFASAIHWDLVRVLLGFAALIALIKKVDILYVVLAGAVISMLVL